MPPNAARPLPRRNPTKPSVVPPPADDDRGATFRPRLAGARHETTAPFDTSAPNPSTVPRTSEIRALGGRTSGYHPPSSSIPAPRRAMHPTGARPSVVSAPPTPRVRLADLAKRTGEPRRDTTLTEGFVQAPDARSAPAPRAPAGPRPRLVPPAPPPATYAPLETTELLLEEIDYDAAYAYDPVALEAHLRRSILPPALTHVADDVRASLAPEGRAEAARELRNMRRTTLCGLAATLRRAAAFFEAHA